MEIQSSVWTLQWSCHGANGGSGAEGQESSAPVWKINGRGGAGGKDGQEEGKTVAQASARPTDSKVAPTWPVRGSHDVGRVCTAVRTVCKYNIQQISIFVFLQVKSPAAQPDWNSAQAAAALNSALRQWWLWRPLWLPQSRVAPQKRDIIISSTQRRPSHC